MKKLNRREFFVKSSLAVGGLIGASTMAFGAMPAKLAYTNDIKFVESSCSSGKKNILVAYQSYCGSTSEVAKSIGDVFANKGPMLMLDILEM